MTSRICKYGCGVLLEGWDDNAKKFIEAGTGGLHTKERCQEAKLKLEQKNNHGNESFSSDVQDRIIARSFPSVEKKEYVDHTLAAARPHLKIKTLTDVTTEGFDLKYNTFAESHNVHFSQYHPIGSMYTMVVWYEEIKQ